MPPARLMRACSGAMPSPSTQSVHSGSRPTVQCRPANGNTRRRRPSQTTARRCGPTLGVVARRAVVIAAAANRRAVGVSSGSGWVASAFRRERRAITPAPTPPATSTRATFSPRLPNDNPWGCVNAVTKGAPQPVTATRCAPGANPSVANRRYSRVPGVSRRVKCSSSVRLSVGSAAIVTLWYATYAAPSPSAARASDPGALVAPLG